jgi:EAL domain-containing protein (putative c-di-GMP-specific phosphodiesterase class I)
MTEPLPEKNSLKEQRDRFLAFAFACADLFIEVSGEGRVIFAAGAAKGVTGIDDKKLIGKKWLELFSVYEQAKMQNAYENAKPGMRKGPILINLSDALGARKAILTWIRMPESDKLYLTLGLSNAIMARVAHAIGDATGFDILGMGMFIEAADMAFSRARASGQDIAMTIIDFAPTGLDRKRIGEPAWKKIRELLAEHLITQSSDGYTAGELSDGRYAFLHDAKMSAEHFRGKIDSIFKQTDPAGEGVTTLKIKTLPADLKTLNLRQTSTAINYAVREFQSKGTGIPIHTINEAYSAYLAANTPKMKEFTGFIERASFNMHFQPIVNIDDNKAISFEILARFEGGGDSGGWIKFGEDMGLAAQFDASMCDRAINHVKFKAGGTWTKFSVNLSPLSLENAEFHEKIIEKLTKDKALAERLMFEITNATTIINLDKAGAFITDLQKLGFTVALDHFTDGPNVSEILIKLHPNAIKIDSRHARNMLISSRDAATIQSLLDDCKAMGIDTIVKGVEDKPTMNMLKNFGVKMCQGHYFGKPAAKPDYVAPRD